jgi:hypothetical protein
MQPDGVFHFISLYAYGAVMVLAVRGSNPQLAGQTLH